MTATTVTDALRQLQFLRDLPDELIQQLACCGQICDYPSGAVIFRQGDEATTMHLVVSGRIALEICAPAVGCKRILTVSEGELLGWSPVLEHSRLTATARALVVAQTVALNGSQVLAICDQNPQFGYAFMKRAALALAKRLNATRLQLLDIYGGQMPPVPDERPQEEAGTK